MGLPKGNAVLASFASENLMHASQALSSNRAPYSQVTRKSLWDGPADLNGCLRFRRHNCRVLCDHAGVVRV